MRPATCHLLKAVDTLWDETCLLTGLRSDLASNPPLVRFRLGLREKLEDGPRPLVAREPGFD